MPQTCAAPGRKRNCEKGMRISTIQPFSLRVVAPDHTPSHESSSHSSLKSVPSYSVPAALTPK